MITTNWTSQSDAQPILRWGVAQLGEWCTARVKPWTLLSCKVGIVGYVYNLSALEVGAGPSETQDHPWLHRMFEVSLEYTRSWKQRSWLLSLPWNCATLHMLFHWHDQVCRRDGNVHSFLWSLQCWGPVLGVLCRISLNSIELNPSPLLG